MSDLEDPIDVGSDAGDDLFGDGDGDGIGQDAASDKDRADSEDRELASDPDEDDRERSQRRYASEEQRQEEQEKVVMDLSLYRHNLPHPSDGEFRSFRVPPFIRIEPHTYNPDTFEPTEWDIENARSDRPKHVIRYRVNPETGELESNALIHRWSDGSATLTIGDEHFEIQRKNLAPLTGEPYEPLRDAHYYAAAAHLSTNTLVTVGHVTEQFLVKPNQIVEDDGIAAFKSRMAKERAAREGTALDAETLKLTQVDPEQRKRAAELAERERAKAQRRRENAQAKQGGYGSRYGGLSVEGLEAGGAGLGGRSKGGAGGSKKRGAPGGGKQKRYRPEYDSDDEPGARRRADNYDYDDGFLARSDEEISEMEDDDDEEDVLEDEEDTRRPPRRKRQKTAESEEDAEGEADDDVPAADHGRHRRRQVIDDDDEDED